jgi:hypothetical protein
VPANIHVLFRDSKNLKKNSKKLLDFLHIENGSSNFAKRLCEAYSVHNEAFLYFLYYYILKHV